MQFTQKAKEHIDSCRFCWMCHHVCPIGNATGLERNTAKARALGLSLVMRDAIEYSDDIIKRFTEKSLTFRIVSWKIISSEFSLIQSRT